MLFASAVLDRLASFLPTMQAANDALADQCAQDPTVADIARVTRRRIQRFWNRSLEMSTRLTTCSQEHREIAGAVARGERDEVEAAVTDHINHMRSSVETILQVAGSVLGATSR